MKIISLMNGKEKVVQDDEAENVKRAVEKDVRFVELRDGSFINTTSIVSIDGPEQKPYLFDFPVYETKSGMYIIRDGERAYLEPKDIKAIIYKEKDYEHADMFRKIQSKQQVLQ